MRSSSMELYKHLNASNENWWTQISFHPHSDLQNSLIKQKLKKIILFTSTESAIFCRRVNQNSGPFSMHNFVYTHAQ